MSRPQKRSLTLLGHATSVSLEAEFWAAFRRIAAARGKALNALAADIDAARPPDTGLASAIRLFVLADLEARLERCEAAATDALTAALKGALADPQDGPAEGPKDGAADGAADGARRAGVACGAGRAPRPAAPRDQRCGGIE